MDVFVREADVGCAWQFFCTGRIGVAGFSDLSTLLRRVVFVGEAALGAGFDFEGVRLGD